MNKIFIKGNVPSSKNSKQWTGKYLVHSKTTQRYLKNYEYQYLANRDRFLKMLEGKTPSYNIHFLFIRDSKRKFDYHNAVQIVADLMVKYKWIEDDNANIFKPIFENYRYDKNNPGVEIWVE